MALGVVAAVVGVPAASAAPTASGVQLNGALRVAYPVANADPGQNYGDLYLPRRGLTGPAPLVVLYRGGGWDRSVSLAGLGSMARDLAARGYAVYNVEYRRVGSGGGWPTTLTDVSAAATFATSLGNIFPQVGRSVILVGHSSGGQLAVWAAQHAAVRPAASVAIAAPLALTTAAHSGDANVDALLGGSPAQFPQRYAMADPAAQACPAVPIVAIHGTADRVVPITNARDFRARPRCPSARVSLVEVPGATHLSLIRPGAVGYGQTLATISATVAGVR